MPSLYSKENAELVFSQDFSQIQDIDEEIWLFDDGPIYNEEVQTYTRKPARNAWIESGVLVLEARMEGDRVSSARLVTHEAWIHGRFEITARVPAGVGTWPAVWLLNDRNRSDRFGPRCDWPLCGEIDIMEYAGFEPGKYHFTLHTAECNHMLETQKTRILTVPELEPTFHDYALEWTGTSVTWFMDGEEVYGISKGGTTMEQWPLDEHYYLILNLAIGGTFGGKQGVDPAIFPCRFEIKSVRVYQ